MDVFIGIRRIRLNAAQMPKHLIAPVGKLDLVSGFVSKNIKRQRNKRWSFFGQALRERSCDRPLGEHASTGIDDQSHAMRMIGRR